MSDVMTALQLFKERILYNEVEHIYRTYCFLSTVPTTTYYLYHSVLLSLFYNPALSGNASVTRNFKNI